MAICKLKREALGEHCWHLDFGLLASKTEKKKTDSVVEATQSVVFWNVSPNRLTYMESCLNLKRFDSLIDVLILKYL